MGVRTHKAHVCCVEALLVVRPLPVRVPSDPSPRAKASVPDFPRLHCGASNVFSFPSDSLETGLSF